MYNFRGKRADVCTYDDAGHFTPEEKFWFHGDDSVEFFVPSPHTLHDKITAERHADIQAMAEEFLKNHPLDKIIKINGNNFYNTNLMEEQNESKTNC